MTEAALRDALAMVDVTGPDDDGFVWLHLNAGGVQALINLGDQRSISSRAGIAFRSQRDIALAGQSFDADAAKWETWARLADPGPAPCDCDRCDCGNIGDAQRMSEWRERKAIYDAIRARGASCA